MGVDKYVLHYFDGRGIAEPARIILSYVQADWEDKRIPMPTVAGQIPDDINLLAPFGQVPLLEVNGKVLSQAQTITRYLGNKYNLAGKDKWDAAKCDEIADATKDFFTLWVQVYKEHDESKKEELKKKIIHDSGRFLNKFNEILWENKTGHLVGKDFTWADFYLAHFVDNIQKIYHVDIVGDRLGLKKLLETVFEEPKIAEWVQNRPLTDL